MQRRPCSSSRKFRDATTADHKVLSEENESRFQHRSAVVVQDLKGYPTKNKTVQEPMTCLQKFVPPGQKPGIILTDIHWIRACEDLCWNHDKSTPYRSETNGIAEHAVRRVKEGTSALLVQSGLSDTW